ncbi:MAG TPA: hypothetical protein VGO11_02935 [Chthoniobacteraceae bacterium]|jgi:hypothetical protein|nr:hypothetical protein [Chthoniobacteraceae bacterium]
MFSSFSDSALSSFRWWVSWIAAGGSGVGVACAVLTILATRETSRRDSTKADATASALLDTQTKLAAAELSSREARALVDQLEIKQRARQITPPQAVSILTLLQRFQPIPIVVEYAETDSEATQFAASLEAAFKAAGYAVAMKRVTLIGDPPGLYLGVRDPKNTPLVAPELQKLFQTLNIDLKPQVRNEIELGTIVLRVAAKPWK